MANVNIIVTVNGVLNTVPSRLKHIDLLADKIVLLNEFIRETRSKLWVLNTDTRLQKDEFETLLGAMKYLGLTVPVWKLHTQQDAKNVVLRSVKDVFVVITSETVLQEAGNAVVYTNKQLGLIQADLLKIKKVLNERNRNPARNVL